MVLSCSPRSYIFLVLLCVWTNTVRSFDAKDGTNECSIQCLNGGVCAIGKRIPTTAELSLHPNYNPSDENNSQQQQYCQCSDGFYGIHCESSYDVCSSTTTTTTTMTNDNTHYYCHLNSTCVYTNELQLFGKLNTPSEIGLPDILCNCTVSKRPGKHFGGRHCQYQNMISCEPKNNFFCTNGGACVKDLVTGPWSCACPEGYNGDHCEYNQEEDSFFEPSSISSFVGPPGGRGMQGNRSNTRLPSKTILIICGLVLLASIFVVTLAVECATLHDEEVFGPTPPPPPLVHNTGLMDDEIYNQWRKRQWEKPPPPPLVHNAPLQEDFYTRTTMLSRPNGAQRMQSDVSIDLLPSTAQVVGTTDHYLVSDQQLLTAPPSLTPNFQSSSLGGVRAPTMDSIPSLKRGGVDDNNTLIELSKIYENAKYGQPSKKGLEDAEDDNIWYGQPNTRNLDDDDDLDRDDLAELI